MTEFDVSALSGATVVDTGGNKIGKVGQVYLDDQTGQPEWVTVNTGLFGTKESFVPLAVARLDGDRPDRGRDQGPGHRRAAGRRGRHISQQEEDEIYRYYGVIRGGRRPDRQSGYAESGTAGYGTTATWSRDHRRDTSGPDTDEAMTRSEEHLGAGTQQTEAGRARLRKHVVTETEQVQVPVSHEEVRVEREPITDANRDAATPAGTSPRRSTRSPCGPSAGRDHRGPAGRTGPARQGDRHRPETVSGEVRKEQIEFDDATGTAQDRRG